jgi:ribonuclease HI
MDKLFVYIDGTSKGEPGEAGIGIAITTPDGGVVEEISRLIGRTTKDVAEYRALIEACRHVVGYKPASVVFFTHNQRLANHINRVFETREPHIKHQIEIALGLLNQLPRWRVNYIDQKVNVRAPRLVEQAFHQSLQAQVTRERMELVLLARAASLSDDAMQRLLDFADKLREED